MGALKALDSNIISLIILLLIFFNVRSRMEKTSIQDRLFVALLQVNMVLLIIDMLRWMFNGSQDHFGMMLNRVVNVLLFSAEPIAAILWILYADFQVHHDKSRIRKLFLISLIPYFIYITIANLSVFTGWYFTFSADGFYRRGRFFWVHSAACYGLMLYSMAYVIYNRRRLKRESLYSMLLFYLPVTLGVALQLRFYGISTAWSGMMLSLLIIYFNIQNRTLSTDYLTGVYNRRQLEAYLRNKIMSRRAEKSFSAILIDLNKFKQINDEYGHDAGDEALKESVRIIQKCIRGHDIVARYGGDEFILILDLDDKKSLERVVERLHATVAGFNRKQAKPYRISFCMGYGIYDRSSGMNADEFIRTIDRHMYENKSCTY